MKRVPLTLCLLSCSLACRESAPTLGDRTGVLLVSDSAEGARYLVLAVPDGELLLELQLGRMDTEHCRDNLGSTQIFCLPYELQHRVDAEGADHLLVMYSPMEQDENGPDSAKPGVLASYSLTDPPSLDWSVDQLDLSAMTLREDEQVCQEDLHNPCNDDSHLRNEKFACAMRMPHAFAVLEDGDDHLRALVADTRNHRVLELDITAGDRCAAVEGIQDLDTVPDWTLYLNPNDVEAWSEGDRHHALVSFKGSDPNGDEQGAAGRGKLMYWSWEQQQPVDRSWVFPPVDTEEPSFLNAPHNVDMFEADDGTRLLMLAHSSGASESWHGEADQGTERGSVLLASCCEEPPEYLADVVPADEELGFLRDVDHLGGGRLVLTDSGCLEPDGCTQEASILELSFAELEQASALVGPGGDGRWSAEHGSQHFLDATIEPWLLDDRYRDVLVGVYEADYIPLEELGDSLTELLYYVEE